MPFERRTGEISMESESPLVLITNLTFTYNRKDHSALENINLDINEGEFVLIAGPSGSGKSTLVRLFNGLIPHFYGGTIQGSVMVDGLDIFSHSTKDLALVAGMVFQSADNQLLMNTVEAELAFGLENLALPVEEIETRITQTLNQIHIDHLRYRKISTLSGGEKQKVAIGAVLAMRPRVLILDEPTSELDPAAATDLLDLIKQLNVDYRLTIFLIEHRIDRVLPFLSQMIIMNDGKILMQGPPQTVLRIPLERYGLVTPAIVQFWNALAEYHSSEEKSPYLLNNMKIL